MRSPCRTRTTCERLNLKRGLMTLHQPALLLLGKSSSDFPDGYRFYLSRFALLPLRAPPMSPTATNKDAGGKTCKEKSLAAFIRSGVHTAGAGL